jgi:hypothetical protein
MLDFDGSSVPEMNGLKRQKEPYQNNNSLKFHYCINSRCYHVGVKCNLVGMNDYIAKPVDERLLYSKIVAVVKQIQMKRVKKI